MLYSFIFETIIFLGIGVIILILARALPRIADETAPRVSQKNKLIRVIQDIPLDKVDDLIKLVIHKTLRKTKIIINKADNFVTEKMRAVRPDSSKKDGTGLPM